MRRPSLALTTLIIFWIVYGVVAIYALYRALPPLNRELLLILVGAAIFPVSATLAFLFDARPAFPRRAYALSIAQDAARPPRRIATTVVD